MKLYEKLSRPVTPFVMTAHATDDVEEKTVGFLTEENRPTAPTENLKLVQISDTYDMNHQLPFSCLL